MTNNVENLDAMNASDLMMFWHKHQNGRKYKLLFPDGGQGVIRATRDLANYAANKSAAMHVRSQGKIQDAMMYEGICERIYAQLPQFAKW